MGDRDAPLMAYASTRICTCGRAGPPGTRGAGGVMCVVSNAILTVLWSSTSELALILRAPPCLGCSTIVVNVAGSVCAPAVYTKHAAASTARILGRAIWSPFLFDLATLTDTNGQSSNQYQ